MSVMPNRNRRYCKRTLLVYVANMANYSILSQPADENEKPSVLTTEIKKTNRIEVKEKLDVKVEDAKVDGEEPAPRVVPVRPIILPAHLRQSQHDLKRETDKAQNLHLGKRSRSFFSDISNHISTYDMSPDVKEAITADRVEEEKALKVASQNWTDLDAEDKNDPMMVTEYVNEIFEYMRVLEVKELKFAHHMRFCITILKL